MEQFVVFGWYTTYSPTQWCYLTSV